MSNVLTFSCPHFPFEHKEFLKFLLKIKKREKCTKVICVGDFFDNYALSFWDKDPDSLGAKNEYEQAIKHAQPYYRAFPSMVLTKSNHDDRPLRVAAKAGLPPNYLRPYQEIIKCPKKWKVVSEYIFEGVLYKHEHSGGQKSLENAINDSLMNVVLGHQHTELRVKHFAKQLARFFGANTGCGIDRKRYAFKYAVSNKNKPMLGCVVVYGGKRAASFPMDLGNKLIRRE